METSPASDTKEEGLRLLKEGKIDEAIEILRQIAKAEPEDPQVHTYLGVAYSKKQDRLHAIAAFEEAARLDVSAKSCYNLGQVYEQVNRVEEAVRQYYAASQIDPNYAPANQALERIRADYAAAHPAPPPEPTAAFAAQPGNPQTASPYPQPARQSGPPDFAEEQAKRQRKLDEHVKALRKSGLTYGILCGAIMLPLVYFCLAFFLPMPGFATKGGGLYTWILVLIGIGGVFGAPIGLWVAHTCGGESAGLQAGAVLGALFGLIIGAVTGKGAAAIVIPIDVVAYAILFGLIGWLVGMLVGRSLGWD